MVKKKSALDGAAINQEQRVKGKEIFVGGLPRTVTETMIQELFSPYGEILELRMMKDQSGNSKGFCFVRFSTKEAAFRAQKERDGIKVQGKKIGVALSSDQDSLFFGNLHKDWNSEEFDKMVREAFKDVVSVDLAMAPGDGDSRAGKKKLNRGFAFVQFSSHAAAARAYRIGSQPDFLLDGKHHPVVDWAEEEPEIDPEELSKVKVAFVGNLPKTVDEEYLKKLFDPFGKVEKVALSRKGQFPVGFVHFAKRSDLENAIKEMNGKTVRGPHRGPDFKIQVAVARPAEADRKRSREPKSNLNNTRDKPNISYDNHTCDSSDHKSKVPRLANLEHDAVVDPYEEAVITLPSAVKERLLRILRLGIATRYDVDIHCITSLKELPESAAMAVLNQFLLSGGDRRDKGAYFASLVSKHQVDKYSLNGNPSYLQRNMTDHLHKESELLSVRDALRSHAVDRDALRSHAVDRDALRSLAVDRDAFRSLAVDRDALRSHAVDRSFARYTPSPVVSPYSSLYDESLVSRSNTGRLEGTVSSYRAPASSSLPYRPSIRSDVHLVSAERRIERPQMRFDPFTGEPYKYDPFTGERIQPESNSGRSPSFY